MTSHNSGQGLVCTPCRQAHTQCDRKQPCGRCVLSGKEEACQPSPTRKRGRRPNHERGLGVDTPATTRPAKRAAGGSFPPPPLSALTFVPGALLPRGPSPPTTSSSSPPSSSSSFSSSSSTSSSSSFATPTSSFTTSPSSFATQHKSKEEAVDTTVSNTLLCMLMDQVRDVRHENGRLRHEVAELRAHREQSDGQVRDLRAAMAAMADAQRESTTQIRALLALFHQSPSSASLSTPPRPTPLRPTPLLLTQEASAGETGETLVDALPFLAEYDCSALIVSNLRQPFIVLRTSLGLTHLGVTHPRIAYVSPSAAAYLGFSPAELVGQMVSKLGGIGAEGKLELVQLMFEKPPSNVSTPITITSTYFIRKNGAPVRLETQHQNLWADSISKWHIVRLRRVLEENVPSPLPVRDLEDLLADPLTLSVIDARLTLVSRTRALDDIHLYWRSRATYLASIAAISPTVSSIVGPSSLAGFVSPLSPITQHASWNPASLSSPSLSASSPSSSSSPATTTTQEDGDSEQTTPSSGHADGHPPEEVVAMGTPGGGPAGLDLDELLGALRSPASGSASELLLDDTAPWLQNAEGRWEKCTNAARGGHHEVLRTARAKESDRRR